MAPHGTKRPYPVDTRPDSPAEEDGGVRLWTTPTGRSGSRATADGDGARFRTMPTDRSGSRATADGDGARFRTIPTDRSGSRAPDDDDGARFRTMPTDRFGSRAPDDGEGARFRTMPTDRFGSRATADGDGARFRTMPTGRSGSRAPDDGDGARFRTPARGRPGAGGSRRHGPAPSSNPGWAKKLRSRIRQGTIPTVRVQGIQLHTLYDTKTPPKYDPAGLRVVDSNTILVDEDGKELVFFLKGGLGYPSGDYGGAVIGTRGRQAADMLRTGPYQPERKKLDAPDGTNCGYYSSPTLPAGQALGTYHFAFWHGIGPGSEGNKRRSLACLSKDLVGRGASEALTYPARWLRDSHEILQAAGDIFRAVQPADYAMYKEHFDRLASEHPEVRDQLGRSAANCFLGHALLCGLSTGPRLDSSDVKFGWVVETCFHEQPLEGGYIELPQLGVKIELRQGDALVLRSRAVWHAVSEVTNGVYRTGMTLFTHESDSQPSWI